MGEFSMELNDDQTTLQEWVHGFAVNQMRPIAAEWDEREETPWEFIQEAAKIGIYSLDFMMNAFTDKTGLSLMIATEELAWERAHRILEQTNGLDGDVARSGGHRRQWDAGTSHGMGAPVLRDAR